MKKMAIILEVLRDFAICLIVLEPLEGTGLTGENAAGVNRHQHWQVILDPCVEIIVAMARRCVHTASTARFKIKYHVILVYDQRIPVQERMPRFHTIQVLPLEFSHDRAFTHSRD